MHGLYIIINSTDFVPKKYMISTLQQRNYGQVIFRGVDLLTGLQNAANSQEFQAYLFINVICCQ